MGPSSLVAVVVGRTSYYFIQRRCIDLLDFVACWMIFEDLEGSFVIFDFRLG